MDRNLHPHGGSWKVAFSVSGTRIQKVFSEKEKAIAWRERMGAAVEALRARGRIEPTAEERRRCRARGVRLECGDSRRGFRVCVARRGRRVQRLFSFSTHGGVRPAFEAAMACRAQLERSGV